MCLSKGLVLIKTVIDLVTWSSPLIFSAAERQCVVIDSFNLSKLSTFFPNYLDTQQIFLLFSNVSRFTQGIPRNSITVLAPKTFVLFLTQVLEIFFNL